MKHPFQPDLTAEFKKLLSRPDKPLIVEVPEGALDFEGVFRAAYFKQKVFFAHSLGDGNFITTGTAFSLYVDDGPSQFICMDYMQASMINIGECFKAYCCISDFNIGKHHNNHFIFTNEDLAKQYLGLS